MITTHIKRTTPTDGRIRRAEPSRWSQNLGPTPHQSMRALPVLCLLLATLLSATPALAEPDEGVPVDDSARGRMVHYDDDNEELEDIDLLELDVPMVVTASRRAEKLSAVPYAASVITADDIRRSGARSIPDALRLAAGMDVADLSFGNAAVSPRGFHGFLGNHALVLVDGRQIFDSLFGGSLWGSWPFQLDDIERIEIIRGPGGVTWGANAVNGVINIITKDPADQLGLRMSSRGGSRGSFRQYVGYGHQEGKLRFRISGEYEASDGFNRGGSILRGLDDEYKTPRIGLHAVYEHDANDTFTLSAGSAVVDGGFPPTPLAGFGVRRNSGSQGSFILGKWSHEVAEDNHFELTGYVNDFHASPGVPSIDYRYQQFALQFAHTFKPAEDHTLTWGLDTRTDLLDATNADPFMLSKSFVSTAIVGFYVQHQWRFARRWTLDLGARLDYEFYGGFQPSARAALSYELSDDAFLYGAVSRAFHMPAAAARFLSIPTVNGLARVTSGRGVDPTTVIAYEIGYRGKLFDRLDTSLTLFWHDFDEVTTLRPELGPPGLVRLDYDNRGGNVALYGAEWEAKYPVTDRLTLLANYTYQQLNWDPSSPFTERDYPTPPKHKFMIAARQAVTDDLHLSAHLYYVDAVQAPNPSNPFLAKSNDPYFRLDLRAEYEFWNDRASLAVGVSNLLDRSHPEGSTLFLNDAEVSRMVYAEFRVSFE